jgi:hypothetical protein
MSARFLNHLDKAQYESAPLGTFETKYLYVEGKSDKNIFARMVLGKFNRVIVTNVSDKLDEKHHWHDDIENEKSSKFRVSKSCHRFRHVYGVIDRDLLDLSKYRIPPKCLLTDYRDLESTLFKVGGRKYLESLLDNLIQPATPFPEELITSFERNWLELAGILEVMDANRAFFRHHDFSGAGSICLALDTLRSAIKIGSTAHQIASEVASIYAVPSVGQNVILPPIEEINGHTIVTAMAICLRVDNRFLKHLADDQLDQSRVKRMFSKYEKIRLEIENRMQNEVDPPLDKTKLANMLVQELRLTKVPVWFQQSS